MNPYAYFDQSNPYAKWLFIGLSIWSLIWKGIALWRAGRNSQKYWFIALLIVNTIGILEIIYLKFFQKDRNIIEPEVVKSPSKHRKEK